MVLRLLNDETSEAIVNARNTLIQVVEDATYERLMAEERIDIAQRGLSAEDILAARERGRQRFLEVVNGA